MTLIRHIPHHISHAIFIALWTAVLITRMVPVDARVLKGNPVQVAPRAPKQQPSLHTRPLGRV